MNDIQILPGKRMAFHMLYASLPVCVLQLFTTEFLMFTTPLGVTAACIVMLFIHREETPHAKAILFTGVFILSDIVILRTIGWNAKAGLEWAAITVTQAIGVAVVSISLLLIHSRGRYSSFEAHLAAIIILVAGFCLYKYIFFMAMPSAG